MAFTTFVDGTTAVAGEVNANFDVCLANSSPKVIYTGAGFDSSQTTQGNDEASQELTAISTADLVGMNYLKIRIFGTGRVDNDGGGTGTDKVELRIQTKDTGGSYTNSLTYKSYIANHNIESDRVRETITCAFTWIHTLTANEKSAGVEVKVFSKSTTSGSTAQCSFVNIQTIIEPMS